MNKKTHDAVATVGEYTDKQGNKKKRYINVGSIFTDDQGRQSLKLDAVPVGKEWSGWISFYPIEDRQQGQQPRRQPEVGATGGDSDIPW